MDLRWSFRMFDIKPTRCFLLFFRAAIFIIGKFPIVKKTALEALETIFATKAVARQLVLAFALESGMVRQAMGLSLTPFVPRYRIIPVQHKDIDTGTAYLLYTADTAYSIQQPAHTFSDSTIKLGSLIPHSQYPPLPSPCFECFR
jgi:hypothetical protein